MSIVSTVDGLNGATFGAVPTFPFGPAKLSLGLPGTSPFPGANVTRENGNQYLDEGRITVTQTLCVSIGRDPVVRAATLSAMGQGQLLFASTRQKPLNAAGENFVCVDNLASLNHKLNAGEREANEYRFYGVQITNTDTDLYNKRSSAAITTVVAHRVSMRDIWMSDGKRHQPGTFLYLLLVDVDMVVAEEILAGVTTNTTHTVTRYMPFASTTRLGAGYLGSSKLIFIGTMGRRRDFVDDPCRYKKRAITATMGTSVEEAKRAMLKLPYIEVMVRI
jgi:hypothetical protein